MVKTVKPPHSQFDLPLFDVPQEDAAMPEPTQPTAEMATAPDKPDMAEKHAKDRAEWASMRRYVMPRQLLKPLNEAESAVAGLNGILSSKPKKKGSYVAQVSERPDPEAMRRQFEEVIAKAEMICRQVRKERFQTSKSEYDTPSLQAHLDKLDTVEPDRRIRSMTLMPSSARLMARTQQLNVLRDVVRSYAQDLGDKFGPDKLVNAYKLDFRGLKGEVFEEHPFIRQCPEISRVIRGLVRSRKMEKLLRDLSGTEEAIVTAASTFMQALPEGDVMRQSTFGRALAYITEMGLPETEQEDGVFAEKLNSASQGLRMAITGQREHYRRHLPSNMLAAYDMDAKAITKQAKKAHQDPVAALNEALTSAKHVEPYVSYLRAKRALEQLADTIDTNKGAIERMYPDRQNPHRGRF